MPHEIEGGYSRVDTNKLPIIPWSTHEDIQAILREDTHIQDIVDRVTSHSRFQKIDKKHKDDLIQYFVWFWLTEDGRNKDADFVDILNANPYFYVILRNLIYWKEYMPGISESDIQDMNKKISTVLMSLNWKGGISQFFAISRILYRFELSPQQLLRIFDLYPSIHTTLRESFIAEQENTISEY
jgi:hypothetical protein